MLRSEGRWSELAEERDAMERRFIERAAAASKADTGARRIATEQCWQEAAEAEARWLHAVSGRNAPSTRRHSYLRSWQQHDQLACA